MVLIKREVIGSSHTTGLARTPLAPEVKGPIQPVPDTNISDMLALVYIHILAGRSEDGERSYLMTGEAHVDPPEWLSKLFRDRAEFRRLSTWYSDKYGLYKPGYVPSRTATSSNLGSATTFGIARVVSPVRVSKDLVSARASGSCKDNVGCSRAAEGPSRRLHLVFAPQNSGPHL